MTRSLALSTLIYFASLVSIAAQTFPSFDCRRASLPTEFAICGSEWLAEKDRELDGWWRNIGSRYGRHPRWVESDQDMWRTLRDKCGQNTQCIGAAYDMRILQLQDIVRGN